VADTKASDNGQIGQAIDLVKTYVRQETVGPLKGLGRKIGFGVGGAFALGLGLFFVSLGLLRLLQTRVHSISHGRMSLVSYAIVFAFCLLVTLFALLRIRKIEKDMN